MIVKGGMQGEARPFLISSNKDLMTAITVTLFHEL